MLYEYRLIHSYYTGKTAERSGVKLINHIDEGLMILNYIGASEIAQRAFCIHPLLQGDTDLKKNIFDSKMKLVDACVLITAMEYRRVANNYLSHRTIQCLKDIELSPLKDVNDMLIADKVQNFKDFELHHKATHERSSELTEYFNNWIRKLGVDYESLKKVIL